MPEPIPTNGSVNREGFAPKEVLHQQHEGPWRKDNTDALRGFNELSNYKEAQSLGTMAMNELYGKHNWKLDNTAYENEAGPDAFGRMPGEKADRLVSPDGDQYRAENTSQETKDS